MESKFLGGEAAGVQGAVLFVESDEFFFLVTREAGKNRMNAAGAGFDLGLGIGDRGLGWSH